MITFPNPFPKRLDNGKVIVDERCTCGELRTRHAPGRAGAFGHGACLATKCAQFTWCWRPPRRIRALKLEVKLRNKRKR